MGTIRRVAQQSDPNGAPRMNVIESMIEDVPLIVIEGELDQSSKKAAQDAVEGILRGPDAPANILFDLTDCTFLDSGGLSVLLSTLVRLPAQGWLGIIGASAGTERVLTYTGFLDQAKVRHYLSSSDAAASLSRERRQLLT